MASFGEVPFVGHFDKDRFMHSYSTLLQEKPRGELQEQSYDEVRRRVLRPIPKLVSVLLLNALSGLTFACSGAESEPNIAGGIDDVPGAPNASVPGVVNPQGNPGVPGPSSTDVGSPGAVPPGAPPALPPPAPIDVTNADCSVPKASGTLMRRLTSFEYTNAVFDLLGVQPT